MRSEAESAEGRAVTALYAHTLRQLRQLLWNAVLLCLRVRHWYTPYAQRIVVYIFILLSATQLDSFAAL